MEHRMRKALVASVSGAAAALMVASAAYACTNQRGFQQLMTDQSGKASGVLDTNSLGLLDINSANSVTGYALGGATGGMKYCPKANQPAGNTAVDTAGDPATVPNKYSAAVGKVAIQGGPYNCGAMPDSAGGGNYDMRYIQGIWNGGTYSGQDCMGDPIPNGSIEINHLVNGVDTQYVVPPGGATNWGPFESRQFIVQSGTGSICFQGGVPTTETSVEMPFASGI